ncbi:hypothetical protein Aab01nite_25760 [Paractinoplanes abujensis]|nr:hypothetical protein Aab01nite_25760 [Actinoplanes abujensis]
MLLDDPDAAGAQQQDRAVEALVADHDVAAARQNQQRPPIFRGITHGSNHLVRFGGDRQGAGWAAEA